ncbi:MAG: hypothetical protein KF745_02815 [Phycisphaeraceae bacterium]|nr:hypothetical protein [Phycisphaeraceae bacterium]
MSKNLKSRNVIVVVSATVLVAGLGVSAASADVLWNNGSMVTRPGQGLGGADVSEASQSNNRVGINSFRVPSNGLQDAKVADDFTVPAGGWTVAGITGYAQMSSSYSSPPSVSPITSVLFQLWSASPSDANDPGAVIASSTTILSNEWSGVYRIRNGFSVTTSNLPVWAVTADFGGLTLAPGNYWVSFNFQGTSPTGGTTGTTPFVMAIDGTGAPVNVDGNGREWTMTSEGTSGWSQTQLGTPVQGVEYPFIVSGTPAPAPGAATLLGLAGLAMARRRR